MLVRTTKKALQCPQTLSLAEGGVWGRDTVINMEGQGTQGPPTNGPHLD